MRGRDSKTYYDSATNWTTPTWVEMTRIINETITPEATMVAGGSRIEEYEDNEVVARKFSLQATYRYKKASVGADTVYAAMLAAFEAGSCIFMLFLDGAVTVPGSKGWRAPVKLTQAPIKRDLGDLTEVTLQGVSCLYDDSGTIRKPTSYTAS